MVVSLYKTIAMTNDQEVIVDPAWTVNETMARYPVTMAVFNRFGIDTCCGSGSLIREAAHDCAETCGRWLSTRTLRIHLVNCSRL
jgi:hypothetical protein